MRRERNRRGVVSQEEALIGTSFTKDGTVRSLAE